MFTLLLLFTSHVTFLIGGIWIGYSNANSSKVKKTKSVIEELTGK